jgi:porin
MRRLIALVVASALAIACLADAAHADPIVLTASEAPTPPSGESMETPGALPVDPSSLLNPVPASLQPLIEQPFQAQIATPHGPAQPPSAGPLDFLNSSLQSPNLLGDMWGLRPALAKYGVTLSVIENAETFGNLTGGVRQGFEVNGLTTATVQLDTQKAFGLNGGLFNVSGLQIWGGDLNLTNLHSFWAGSFIEAEAAVRLWELWYQQKFSDKFDIKIGEQSLDQEFIVSQNASYLLYAVNGWPLLPTFNLPGGGPAYPLAGLGVRGRAQVTNNFTVLAGLFNGSPIPRNSPDTQLSNPYGVSFPLNTDVLAIAELQFMFPGSDASAKANDQSPLLPGAYKIGAWYDSYVFNDQRYDNTGLPLASPASDGIPATHHGDFSVYGVMDQMIWRSKDDANRNLNFYMRPMFTPFQDRNLISFSVDAGLTLHEPLQGRANDTFGLAMGVARVSNSASGYDRDLKFYNPSVYTPVRSTETFLEATYQIQVLPWWQIQPDLQYVINPDGGIANPNDPTQRIKDELVIGLRTNITF